MPANVSVPYIDGSGTTRQLSMWTEGGGDIASHYDPYVEAALAPNTAIAHGALTVGTSALVLGASTPAKRIILKALTTNTGIVFIGASGVTVTSGFPLQANDPPFELAIADLSSLYAIASAASQGLRWLILN